MATHGSMDEHDKTGTQAVTSNDQALIATLRDHFADSLLPGDAPLSQERLTEIAAFVFEAAQERTGDEPALLIRSALDGRRFTRFAIINTDMPFLVDSVAALIAAEGLAIDLLMHPILPVRRDARGKLVSLPEEGAVGASAESMIYLETARLEAKVRRSIEQQLRVTLADVRAAVADWPAMQHLLLEDAGRVADSEGSALLRWLGSGMTTQLGHVTMVRDGSRKQLLGICRTEAADLLAEETIQRAFAWFEESSGGGGQPGRAPLIIKANRLSRVHRRIPFDLFIVPLFEDGRLAALSVHAGIWTSAALATPPAEVPVLRRQLHTIMDRLDLEPGSHDAKALVHALTILPHDLVIGFSDDDITRVATTMMSAANRPRPRVATVVAPLQRHVFAFVWLPREALSTQVQTQIQQLLQAEIGAETLDWSLLVEGGNLAMLRFVLDFRGQHREPDIGAIDEALQALLRGWTDAVEDALATTEEPGRAAALATRYAEAFPATYRTAHGPAEAAQDIGRIRHLSGDDQERPLRRDARLYRHEGDPPDRLRLKIYQLGGAMPLSDAVPALENFGFRVVAELPSELAGPESGTIHDFQLGLPAAEDAAALLQRAAPIEQAINAVINARAEDDVFNRLVTGTNLGAREADWLRAFYRYLRQTKFSFTIYTVVDALKAAPSVTTALVDLFRARHDPSFAGDKGAGAAEAEQRITQGLSQVSAINDDRLLRLYWSTIAAVLRTNAFVPSGMEALAFKFDSALLPNLPRPVPWREIFVYSRRVEGIHLRAGPVARGGLRWSERRDDFRTEVLGLMKAQRVKNAVIVPTGAKGGFFPKRLPNPATDRDAWFAEGKESYKLFIRTLLSITDNIVDDAVVHPDGVVIHDGPDPYFVVAADKGTATFSDTANAIAQERGFWLGDAFASGGSQGYDHKAMGITARGAWISVQRHFLERGVDVQTQPVRVVGCGDMSGDVFGNGMLLSRELKLVAAFDHRHIFIDPDPDPAISWEERRRLFDLPRSSWADYSEALLSKGGGVYARTLKRIPLSAEARSALGIAEEELDPESLISALLCAPVDLLWFGGIGTYIKARHESHADVGDPANDSLRVNAADVRAAVIGEGANLGVTQAGRIEFGLGGGRSNTDFIDNSAGVDCSDNEVNIKIALASASRAGQLSQDQRNRLLVEMTDEVAELVLEDNRLQALALSIAEQGGSKAVASLMHLIDALEDLGQLDRRTEGLAANDEFTRRAAEGIGLTRPELAVLLSTTKLVLQEALEQSDLSQDIATEPLLLEDFPPRMRAQLRGAILQHPLRREIVATSVANRLVNRMGLVHPFELAEEEGTSLSHVGAAFVSAVDLLGMNPLWEAIDEAAMPEEARLALFQQAALALRGHMADLLRTGGDRVLQPSALIEQLAGGVADLLAHVDELLAPEARGHSQAIAQALATSGAPEELATRVSGLFALDGAIGLSGLARDTGIAPVALAKAFITLGERLGLDWAQSRAAVMNPSDPWERLLVAGLARDFQQMRFDFLRQLAAPSGGSVDPLLLIEEWTQSRQAAIQRVRTTISRAQSAALPSPTMLAQIASQARNLLKR